MVGDGQEYHGPTAERDKRVVQLVAQKLFERLGNSIEIITGGMPGIPMDFADAWLKAGGIQVTYVVSDEYFSTLEILDTRVKYKSGGKTQSERRQALFQWPGLTAAFFVQGGQYTTDEIIKCQKKGLPAVCFVGSGGASGGAIPYKKELPRLDNVPEWMKNTDPAADPDELASQLVETLVYCFH